MLGLVSAALREHDTNAAALTVGSRETVRATSLASAVLDLASVGNGSLLMRADGDERLGFRAADGNLPFTSGSFRWSAGVLGCALAMPERRCWIDTDRMLLSHPAELPAAALASCIGGPLSKLVRIEGLDFEAAITRATRRGAALTVDIMMPVRERRS